MNAEQLQKGDRVREDSETERLRSELNPDDFSEAGEKGLEDIPASIGDVPTPEWNPDDFPEAEQENQ